MIAYPGSVFSGADGGVMTLPCIKKFARPLLPLLALLSITILAPRELALAVDTGKPTFRVEFPDAHSAVIIGLAVSADGSIVATGSNDHTVRIWSVPSLQPLRTIYLPVGRGNQGAAYTVAFSPDAQSLVASGWTGSWNGQDDAWCFYVISVATGDIERAVCDLPHRANHAAFSPDGNYLALAMKAANGLRVYRTSDYSLVAEDREYGRTSTWVEFDRSGRLATTSYDGKIRLYDRNFKLIVSRAMPQGRRPDSLSFSPDGGRIAVAYDEPEDPDPPQRKIPAIDVISSTDLEPLYRPDLGGVNNGTLWRVAWSADGNFLYAGGTWQKGNRFPIRRWADGGKGKPRDLPGAPTRNLRLRALPAGGLVFVGEVPYIGLIGTDGRLVARRPTAMADFTDIGDRLAVSHDGFTVQFAFEPSGEEPAHFSLLERTLELGMASQQSKLNYPVTEAAGLDVRAWSRGYHTTLNDVPLIMTRTDEHALSLTFTPDGKGFVLGTIWNLIRYDANGKIQWTTKIPYAARGVVVTQDGRLVVAAIGDGTIRWYAMDTGKELLAFFPHRDGERWLTWTPSGYYMSSVNGETLVGWTVNRGQDKAADFFSVGRFRNEYYRPNIVERTLTVLDEESAILKASAEGHRGAARFEISKLLPPVIKILEPRHQSITTDTKIDVRFRVRAPSGEPIKEILIRSEGLLLGKFAPPKLNGKNEAEGTLRVTVPQRDIELLLFARNRFAVSEPATVHIKWSGAQVGIAADQRKLYVLAVGVSNYDDPKLKLGFAAKDAIDFVNALKRQTGKAYTEVVPRILIDRDATLAKIREGLIWLGDNVRSDDIGMVFLSGHGVDDPAGTYYYLPRDVDKAHIASTALPYFDLVWGLQRIVGNTVLFVDTCHAGDVFGQRARVSMDVVGLVNQLSEPSVGVIVYASSTGKQTSLESSTWNNGAFAKAVVEGIDGAAKYRNRNYITTSMLGTFVKERVKDLTGHRQTPTVNMPLSVHDLLLAHIN
jgi:WD40 repeat protein